jgi:hypothetical protein
MSVLVKKDASLNELQAAIEDARKEGNPFSHIHILAHGVRFVEDELVPDNFEYGLALHSEQKKPVRSKELAQVLKSNMGRLAGCG